MQVAKGSLFRSRVKLPEQSAKRAPRADAAYSVLSYLTLPHPISSVFITSTQWTNFSATWMVSGLLLVLPGTGCVTRFFHTSRRSKGMG